nr:retrovirus-related Pol polyprotein from transposon TNT 1-94 [Tanacetum cinerariifolium]
RNKVNWHYVRDDQMFMTINLKTKSSFDTTVTLPPTAAVGTRLFTSAKGKQPATTSKAKSLTALSEVAMTEAQQLKLATKRSLLQTHISQASGSGADEGTGTIPGVPDVPTKESDEEISWKSIDEGDDDEEEGDDGDDDEEGNNDDEEGDDDDDDQKGGSDDEQAFNEEGKEFIHPSLSTHDEEETRDEESFDPIPKTPKNTDDEGNSEKNLGMNVSREEGQDKEDEEDELYRDININLGRGVQIADVHTTQEFKDSHVTLTLVNPDENDEFLKTIDENMHKIIKEQVKEQVKVQVSKILPKIKQTVNEQLEAEVLTRSSNSSKTSYAVATDLSEMELKKILIEKMEGNKSIHRSNEKRNLYKALVEAYESNKIILDTYGDTVTLKRRRDDDADKSGSKNRPPMLNKESYVPWSSRLLRYAKSRPNRKLIHNSIINGPYVRRMIPEPGDTNREVPVNETFHVQTNDELIEKELKQIEADDQAIQTILLGLFEEIYAAVDKWSRHVTIVHQTKDLHTADYTQLYDFLKYNQKEVDELKAERLVKTQDPLALMATSNNPYNFLVPHLDQPSFNENYMQQPMPNPDDITDPTTAMNMALALMAKAFKLNYKTPTNNNQRISSNPWNGNQNPNGKSTLVVARAKGNATGHNGNQIRCYNCRGVEEKYTKLLEPIRESYQVPQNDNNVISEVTSMEKSGETVEQHPANVKKTRALYDSLYQNLAIEVEKVTSNSIHTPQKSKVMNNDKVIAPGMFRINPFKTSRDEKHVPNTIRASVRIKPITVSQPPVFTKKDVNSDSNGLSSTGIDNTKTKRPQPRSNTKNDRVPSASARNLKLLINFVWKFLGTVCFRNDHVATILGFGQFCDSNLKVAFRRNACFIRNLEGVDLLKGDRSTNLYTLNFHDMASASPICLIARASSTKSWLWHQRLSHLNFDTINDLAKDDLVSGLPKFKYHKEHLCPSCEQGKSKRASHPPKPVPNSRQRLHLLHMDLCGPMRIASINRKRYVLVIVDDLSLYLEFKNQVLKEYIDSVGISHQVSSIRTPQQNGVVKRRNRTLVEAARTMLIFSRAPVFLWAEAIATACFTQNRSIVHYRFNKTPYELINGRKPYISFLHVFGALCYLKNDREDIGKLGAKGDIGFFICYSADSCAYRTDDELTKKELNQIEVDDQAI